MQRLALAAFVMASMSVAAPVLAQSAPSGGAPVATPTPAAPPVVTPANDGGCAWKKKYTS